MKWVPLEVLEETTIHTYIWTFFLYLEILSDLINITLPSRDGCLPLLSPLVPDLGLPSPVPATALYHQMLQEGQVVSCRTVASV